MIYDYVLSTGHQSVSGCSSVELQTDTFNLFNKKAGASNNQYYYDRNLNTGSDVLDLYLDGQNLLPESVKFTQILNEKVYTLKTGDFFVKGEEASVYDRSELYFDTTTPVGANSNIEYSIITGGIFAGTGDLGRSLRHSILNKYGGFGTAVPFDEFEYFLNGQKVYSGAGVGASAASSAPEPNFAMGDGVVTSLNKDKFKYTAHKKRSKTIGLTGRYSDDVYGSGFIEKRTVFYINGINQSAEQYLELYTGVSIIKTGFDATLSGGFPEILSGNSFEL